MPVAEKNLACLGKKPLESGREQALAEDALHTHALQTHESEVHQLEAHAIQAHKLHAGLQTVSLWQKKALQFCAACLLGACSHTALVHAGPGDSENQPTAYAAKAAENPMATSTALGALQSVPEDAVLPVRTSPVTTEAGSGSNQASDTEDWVVLPADGQDVENQEESVSADAEILSEHTGSTRGGALQPENPTDTRTTSLDDLELQTDSSMDAAQAIPSDLQGAVKVTLPNEEELQKEGTGDVDVAMCPEADKTENKKRPESDDKSLAHFLSEFLRTPVGTAATVISRSPIVLGEGGVVQAGAKPLFTITREDLKNTGKSGEGSTREGSCKTTQLAASQHLSDVVPQGNRSAPVTPAWWYAWSRREGRIIKEKAHFPDSKHLLFYKMGKDPQIDAMLRLLATYRKGPGDMRVLKTATVIARLEELQERMKGKSFAHEAAQNPDYQTYVDTIALLKRLGTRQTIEDAVAQLVRQKSGTPIYFGLGTLRKASGWTAEDFNPLMEAALSSTLALYEFQIPHTVWRSPQFGCWQSSSSLLNPLPNWVCCSEKIAKLLVEKAEDYDPTQVGKYVPLFLELMGRSQLFLECMKSVDGHPWAMGISGENIPFDKAKASDKTKALLAHMKEIGFTYPNYDLDTGYSTPERAARLADLAEALQPQDRGPNLLPHRHPTGGQGLILPESLTGYVYKENEPLGTRVAGLIKSGVFQFWPLVIGGKLAIYGDHAMTVGTPLSLLDVRRHFAPYERFMHMTTYLAPYVGMVKKSMDIGRNAVHPLTHDAAARREKERELSEDKQGLLTYLTYFERELTQGDKGLSVKAHADLKPLFDYVVSCFRSALEVHRQWPEEKQSLLGKRLDGAFEAWMRGESPRNSTPKTTSMATQAATPLEQTRHMLKEDVTNGLTALQGLCEQVLASVTDADTHQDVVDAKSQIDIGEVTSFLFSHFHEVVMFQASSDGKAENTAYQQFETDPTTGSLQNIFAHALYSNRSDAEKANMAALALRELCERTRVFWDTCMPVTMRQKASEDDISEEDMSARAPAMDTSEKPVPAEGVVEEKATLAVSKDDTLKAAQAQKRVENAARVKTLFAPLEVVCLHKIACYEAERDDQKKASQQAQTSTMTQEGTAQKGPKVKASRSDIAVGAPNAEAGKVAQDKGPQEKVVATEGVAGKPLAKEALDKTTVDQATVEQTTLAQAASLPSVEGLRDQRTPPTHSPMHTLELLALWSTFLHGCYTETGATMTLKRAHDAPGTDSETLYRVQDLFGRELEGMAPVVLNFLGQERVLQAFITQSPRS